MNSSTGSTDTYGTRGDLETGGATLSVYRLGKLADQGFDVSRLPFSLKILLENLLRHEDGLNVTPESIAALASWAKTTGAANTGGGQGPAERAKLPSPRPGS